MAPGRLPPAALTRTSIRPQRSSTTCARRRNRRLVEHVGRQHEHVGAGTSATPRRTPRRARPNARESRSLAPASAEAVRHGAAEHSGGAGDDGHDGPSRGRSLSPSRPRPTRGEARRTAPCSRPFARHHPQVVKGVARALRRPGGSRRGSRPRPRLGTISRALVGRRRRAARRTRRPARSGRVDLLERDLVRRRVTVVLVGRRTLTSSPAG